MRSILQDRLGNLWFGSDGEGVYRYDGVSYTYLSEKRLDTSPVRSLCQDRDGNLWFGTNGEDRTGNLWFGTDRGGVARFDGNVVVDMMTMVTGK